MQKAKLFIVICIVSGVMLICGLLGVALKNAPLKRVDDSHLAQIMPKCLVEAKVVSAVAEEGKVRSELEVSRVFNGNVRTGSKFFHTNTQTGDGGTGTLWPHLKKGEIGIWNLSESDRGISIYWGDSFVTQGLELPSRQGISARYDQVKAAAEAIEKVSHAESKNRLRLLKKYVKSQVPEVSIVAANIMGGLNDETLMRDIHHMLLSSELCIAGQVAIDRVLSEGETEDAQVWRNCDERKTLLQKWVASKLDEYEAETVRRRIDLIAQNPGGLDYETVLNLVKVAIGNESIPVSVRRNYLWTIRWIYERSELGRVCFKFLVEQVRVNKNEAIRSGAAHAIRNFVKLDADQTAELEKVVKDLQDSKVVENLTETSAKQRAK